ncbi:polyketide synthase [Mycolicibacterium sarraceniae]|uniref:Polyketide synthase n=1 Tax=Mycolicibacterium sarraceniae TaxID=1534348 RepID=A0A7I7SXB1_9MYCO|nr:polyketide synthase [Mycolicibacterium sarraceniae]
MVRLSAPLSHELTDELDGAVEFAGLGVEEVLLAALGRAIARTIGVGFATISGLTTVRPVRLCCAEERHMDANALLADVREALTPARQLSNAPADVVFSFLGLPPDPALGPLQLTDGPALGVLAYRGDGELQMDWWFDGWRLDHCTIEELTIQFRLGLIGLTSEAIPA